MNWLDIIETAPEESGVYIFKGEKGKYIYIGKAKNIKKRLKNHLQQIKIDPKEKKIFEESKSLEWIITSSEYEAFVLENELIKQYKPRYNIKLKTGTGYPMIVITDDEYPTVKISRVYGEIKGRYFGPFIPARTARAMKNLIHKLFKLRTCDPLPVRDIVCFDYHLGLCSAPCVNKISKKEYKLDAKAAEAFLSGNVKSVIYELYDRIKDYTDKMMFEKAAIIRDQIKALENIAQKQEVVGLSFEEGDIFYFLEKKVFIIFVRGSRVVGKDLIDFEITFSENPYQDIIVSYYNRGNYIPEMIFTNKKIEEKNLIENWLYQKGKKVCIYETIPEEIERFIKRNISLSSDLSSISEEFENVFGFKLPSRIEGFDISTLQGDFNVGSCVVWEDGRMKKREYRRFRIKTVKGIDDYASIREVLFRRFKKYTEMETLPLVLIDGGKGHLKQGLIVRDALGLEDLRIFSIAKKEEIIFTDDGKKVRLYEHPDLLRLFTEIRDEAHRFAISYNRKLREKQSLKEILDNIEGVGKKRKEILYRTFKTVENIAKADIEHLKRLGIPEKVAQNIKKYLSDIYPHSL